jgi:hypothetical protein
MSRILALLKLKNNVICMSHANGYVRYILVDLHLFPETMFLNCLASEPRALKYLWLHVYYSFEDETYFKGGIM